MFHQTIFKKNQRGMTLMETLIAMGIFTLLVGGAASMLLTSIKSKNIVYDQLYSQGQARKVAESFMNEIRESNYSSIGSYPIVSATSTQIIFFSNINQDLLMERIRYTITSTTLQKGTILPSGNPLTYVIANEVTSTLIDNLTKNTTSTIFTYYTDTYTDASNTPMTYPIDITSVSMIGVNLTLDTNTSTSPAPFTLSAKAQFRNLKVN